MDKILELAFEIADKCFSGHFTLMKFTTNYRAIFGEQLENLDTQSEEYPGFTHLPSGKTLEEAITNAIIRELKK